MRVLKEVPVLRTYKVLQRQVRPSGNACWNPEATCDMPGYM